MNNPIKTAQELVKEKKEIKPYTPHFSMNIAKGDIITWIEKDYLKILKQTEIESILTAKKEAWQDELEFLENQVKQIDKERDLAEKANTNNGRQSLLILWMWRVQNIKRIEELKSAIKIANG